MIHTAISLKDRAAAFEKLRQEILGSRPAGRFETFEDLECQLEPDDKEAEACAVLRSALMRDARHSSAGPVYMRKLGLNQALRCIYGGSKRLVRGGVR